jgi:hypothetical protein
MSEEHIAHKMKDNLKRVLAQHRLKDIVEVVRTTQRSDIPTDILLQTLKETARSVLEAPEEVKKKILDSEETMTVCDLASNHTDGDAFLQESLDHIVEGLLNHRSDAAMEAIILLIDTIEKNK